MTGTAQPKRDATGATNESEARFMARLGSCAREVEAHLAKVLEPSANRPDEPRRIAEAMHYATLGGGKRFRPFLVMETAGLFGVPDARALNVAAALECIHCYSLVHDDLPAMDDDDFRRGRPTTHKAYDEATAILVGDGLQALAFELLAEPDTDPDPAVRSALVLELARASGRAGMVGGQMLDLIAEDGSDPALNTMEGVRRIQALKTGALIECAAVTGAVLGRAKPDELKAVTTYARALGLAFQVADDLLDVEGTAEQVGKATNKDAAAGKATFVSLIGVPAAREKLRALEAEASGALSIFGAKADLLKAAAHFMTTRKN